MSTEITTPILFGKNKPKYTDTNTKNQAMNFANQNQTNEAIMPPPKLRRAKSDQIIHLSELQLAKNEIIELKKSMKRLKYQNKLLTQNSTGQLCQSCQVENWPNNDDDEENKNTNENENEIENNDDTQSIASKDSSCPLEPKESFDSYTSSETDSMTGSTTGSTTGRTTPTTYASSTSSISSTEEASVPVQMLTNATLQHMQQMQQMHMQQQHLQYILQHQQMCMAAAAYHQQQQQQQQHHQQQHHQQQQQQQYHRQYKPHQHQQHHQHRSPHEYQLQQHQPSHQEPQPQLVVGTKFDGVVSNVTEFGIFVDLSLVTETGKLLNEGISGMVHVSCFNTTERVEDPHDIYEVGDTISGVYLQGWKPGGRMRLTMVPMESKKVEEEVTDELGAEP